MVAPRAEFNDLGETVGPLAERLDGSSVMYRRVSFATAETIRFCRNLVSMVRYGIADLIES